METLPEEILREIIQYLDRSDLLRTSVVSHRWWNACVRILNESYRTFGLPEVKTWREKYWLMRHVDIWQGEDAKMSESFLQWTMEQDSQHWRFGTISKKDKKGISGRNLIKKAIESSSIDHDNENIGNTILLTSELYWSSAPNDTEKSDEYLGYELCSTCLVKEIRVRAYKEGPTIFAPKQVRFRIGNSETTEYFKSPKFSFSESDDVQIFRVESPSGVIGKNLVVELLGKYNRQFAWSGYYCCIASVQVLGVILHPNVHVNGVDSMVETELRPSRTSTIRKWIQKFLMKS